MPKQFRVLGNLPDNCPRYIPWGVVAPHEEQALKNHDQTLERLNERGGLAPEELFAVLQDKHWRETEGMCDREAAVDFLLKRIEEFNNDGAG